MSNLKFKMSRADYFQMKNLMDGLCINCYIDHKEELEWAIVPQVEPDVTVEYNYPCPECEDSGQVMGLDTALELDFIEFIEEDQL